MMKLICPVFVIAFIIFTFDIGIAQENKSNYDQVYNRDTELYNGPLFIGIYRGNVKGSQFFESNDFKVGELQLGTNLYTDQLLNYDVYDQKLLLSFTDNQLAQKIIEVPLENIRHFKLYGKYFEVIKWKEENSRIFQVFNFKENKILIHWTKNLKSTSSEGHNIREYNHLKKKIWILFNGEKYSIKKNKDLLELYSEEERNRLKKWLNENKLKINKANDLQMILIVNYLNEI